MHLITFLGSHKFVSVCCRLKNTMYLQRTIHRRAAIFDIIPWHYLQLQSNELKTFQHNSILYRKPLLWQAKQYSFWESRVCSRSQLLKYPVFHFMYNLTAAESHKFQFYYTAPKRELPNTASSSPLKKSPHLHDLIHHQTLPTFPNNHHTNPRPRNLTGLCCPHVHC